jgi:hypothetical protein
LSLGPDEGTYAALAKYVSNGSPVETFPTYGPKLYNSAKTIILPSTFFIHLGFHELTAVRLTSTLFGFLSSIMIALCYIAFINFRNTTSLAIGDIFNSQFIFLFGIFSFFPSNFVWSTLGLRESASQFWLLLVTFLLIKLYTSLHKESFIYALLATLALAVAYGARPETALIFTLVVLLFSLVLFFKLRRVLPLMVILVGAFSGQGFTTTPKVTPKASVGAFQIIETSPLVPSASSKPVESASSKPVESASSKPVESASSKPVESASSKPVENSKDLAEGSVSRNCQSENQIIKVSGKKYICKSYTQYGTVERNPIETFQQQIAIVEILDDKTKVNALDAASALPPIKCEFSYDRIIQTLSCAASELPYRLFTFLFRPLIFIDQGSASLNYAAAENVLWTILIALAMYQTVRLRQKPIDRLLNFNLGVYVFTFACAAALYEGNLGTSFRHKSSILWPLILMLMLATLKSFSAKERELI